MSHIDTLQITAGETGKAVTPQQKRFNTLIRQIERSRQTLAAWHTNISAYQQAHVNIVLPLQKSFMAAGKERVLKFDALLGQQGWTRAERDTLRELICDEAGRLLDANDDDAALKALFDKHNEVDFDTEKQEMLLAMKDLAQAMTGLDLGNDDAVLSEEDLFMRMQQEMHAQSAAAEAERAAKPKPKPRRKTAAQERREAEEQHAMQSVREIFRKLASALHPDRETDPHERAVKTSMMQRVNQAYAANDLLALLELQLEIEQVDASHIAKASAQRLNHYNKVLSEQLTELKSEIERVELGFRIDFGLEPGWGMNPGKLGGVLEAVALEIRVDLAELERELRLLNDKAATKRWLKRQAQMLREDEFDTDFF